MQYNPSFVAHRNILSTEDQATLHAQAASYPLEQFKNDARNYEEMVVDFVYTSAKIEGNTYDRVDTDNLLRMGVTAGGKRYSDAVMLVNLRNGFEQVMLADAQVALDINYLCDLHKVLMKDLLPLHEQGLVRTSAVSIGASRYQPPADTNRLRTEMQFILQEAMRYTDVFERAIYLHCNLAYLQYFRDGNKRSARLMQTATLVQGNTLPLFFNDTLIDDYQRAIVMYYETGAYEPYVSFFKTNYTLALSKLQGQAQFIVSSQDREEFERRVKNLNQLQTAVGAAHAFWQHAQQALAQAGTANQVNWPNVERQAIITSLTMHKHNPEDIAQALCCHSPGACSTEQQQAIVADIRRLAQSL